MEYQLLMSESRLWSKNHILDAEKNLSIVYVMFSIMTHLFVNLRHAWMLIISFSSLCTIFFVKVGVNLLIHQRLYNWFVRDLFLKIPFIIKTKPYSWLAVFNNIYNVVNVNKTSTLKSKNNFFFFFIRLCIIFQSNFE